MLKPIMIGAMCLALLGSWGCTREDPRATRKQMLEEERSRSSEQMTELRHRLEGQARR